MTAKKLAKGAVSYPVKEVRKEDAAGNTHMLLDCGDGATKHVSFYTGGKTKIEVGDTYSEDDKGNQNITPAKAAK